MAEYLKVGDQPGDLKYLPVDVIFVDVIPPDDDTCTLGSLTKRWKELYLSRFLQLSDSEKIYFGTHASAPMLYSGNIYDWPYELFLQPRGGDQYAELGLMPSGHPAAFGSILSLWNASDYLNGGFFQIVTAIDGVAVALLGGVHGTGTKPTEIISGLHLKAYPNQDLGGAVHEWRDLYLSGTIKAIGSTALVPNLNADLLDSKHYGDIASEIDDNIAAHAAIADAHHPVHVKTLADHPLSIIPTMDDAHIPDTITRDTELAAHAAIADAHHDVHLKTLVDHPETIIPVLSDAKYPNALLRDGSRTVAGNVLPDGDATRNLGALATNFANVYARALWCENHALAMGAGPGKPVYFAADDAYKLVLSGDKLYPLYGDAFSLGDPLHKFSDIWAVTTHFGDLTFTEKTCPICGLPFRKGDALINYVKDVDEEGTHTVPAHLRCWSSKKHIGD